MKKISRFMYGQGNQKNNHVNIRRVAFSPSTSSFAHFHTYDFASLEFGAEPGVVAELTSTHSTPFKVLWEAAYSGD